MDAYHHQPNAFNNATDSGVQQHQLQEEANHLMKRGVQLASHKIQMDSDDACSNDAFVFAQQQRQQQYLMNIVSAANASPAGAAGSSLEPPQQVLHQQPLSSVQSSSVNEM